jgi:hypothetical protein
MREEAFVNAVSGAHKNSSPLTTKLRARIDALLADCEIVA